MRRWMMTISMACACGPTVATNGDDTTTGGLDEGVDPEETFGDAEGDPSSPTTMTSSDPATTQAPDTGEGGDDEGSVFLPAPDLGDVVECDVWIDDCPAGFKCMPWSYDGSGAWNATKCTPLADDPNAIGEPCTVEGNGASGIDDCVAHAMCWVSDYDSLDGVCIGLCYGSEAEPLCAEPCTSCHITADGAANTCRPSCDPLAQDCAPDEGCYAPYSGDAFSCAPAVGSGKGVAGAPCEFVNVCEPGLHCVPTDRVPDCEGSYGCCAPFCDALAESPCAELPGGVECIPVARDARPNVCVPGLVGVCMLPE